MSILPDTILKLVVIVGFLVPVLAGFASVELGRRSDREIATANSNAKMAEQHTAEANARLGQTEVELAKAKIETEQLSNRAKELDLKLAQTRNLVGQRVISVDQAKELSKIAPECGRGVNIQVSDEHDTESSNFAFSLGVALRQAGIKVNDAWLVPSLETSSGADVIFYSPKYGSANVAEALHSQIARFFKSIEMSALPISGAIDTSAHGPIIVGQTKENMQLDYCIMVIMKRPSPTLNGPVWPQYPGPIPKDTDFQ